MSLIGLKGTGGGCHNSFRRSPGVPAGRGLWVTQDNSGLLLGAALALPSRSTEPLAGLAKGWSLLASLATAGAGGKAQSVARSAGAELGQAAEALSSSDSPSPARPGGANGPTGTSGLPAVVAGAGPRGKSSALRHHRRHEGCCRVRGPPRQRPSADCVSGAWPKA